MATGWPMKVTYANGDVFSSSDINDTNGTINLLGSSVAYAAGKNKILNADFRFNQRAFTSTTTDLVYGFDRWQMSVNGGTCTYSAQTFTPGTAPVAGYESINFARLVTASQTLSSHYAYLGQRIEDARTFAGQTATISFWAKAASGTPSVGVTWYRNYGTGGSPSATEYAVSAGQKTAITTSWARYSLTFAINSVSGKTFGTTANTSWITPFIWTSAGTDYNTQSGSLGLQNVTIDLWGIQVEQGSTATAFQTATGTIQGELAACQRYYWRVTPAASGKIFSIAQSFLSTQAIGVMPFPVTMRIAPTSMDQSGTANHYAITDSSFTARACTAVPTLASNTTDSVGSIYITATNMVAGYATTFQTNNTAAYIGWSAEL
jgi:hypothetical protein